MAHTKQQGGANKHVKRPGQRLGVKVYGGETIRSGGIIVRQKGTKFHSGKNTKLSKDFTIFATKDGTVEFKNMTDKHAGQKRVEVA